VGGGFLRRVVLEDPVFAFSVGVPVVVLGWFVCRGEYLFFVSLVHALLVSVAMLALQVEMFSF
jgi:hypothetical protein